MGRRLNIAEPMTVDTLLTPLNDKFKIVPSDVLEQWYYVNTDTYSPNRQTTPLVLTPTIEAVDPETNKSYKPSFSTVEWYVRIGNGSETKADSVTSETIYQSGATLVVRQNVSGTNYIGVRCRAVYVDPRDLAYIEVGESVVLTASRDATVNLPDITLLCEKMIPFNPLRYNPSDANASPLVTIPAQSRIGGVDVTADTTFKWFATDDTHTIETAIDATTQSGGVTVPVFPCFVSKSGASLVINMMYTERINIICRAVKDATTGECYPAKAYATARWIVPPIDGITVSKQGASVNSTAGDKVFEMIVNMQGESLSDNVKRAHLLYNWFSRKSNITTLTNKGWGETLRMTAEELKSTRVNGILPTSLVHANIYMRGAYEPVRQGDEVVTQGGVIVYERG